MSRACELRWPSSRGHEALALLAQRSGHVAAPSLPLSAAGPIERYADQLGIELEHAALTPRQLHALGPAVVYTRHDGAQHLLAVLGSAGGRVRLVAPDGSETSVTVAALRAAIWDDDADALTPEVERLIASTLHSPRLRARARTELREHHRDPSRACRALLLHALSEASLGTWLRRYGLVRGALLLLGLHAAQYGLGLLAFWTLGRAVLADRIDAGVFSAFGLLSLSVVPLHLLEGAQLAELSLRTAALFKQRAFSDALASDQDALKRRGVGEHFGHVLDCDSFENLALTGGLSGALALLELIAAAAILAWSSGPWLVVTLALWLVLLGVLCSRYLRAARALASGRLALTDALVERMLAHRTRLVQEPRERWHAGEDALLESYLLAGREHDTRSAQLIAWSGRGFLTLAIAVLAPEWLNLTSSAIAAGLAGALLAYRALSRLSNSLSALCDAKLAYERLTSIRSAAAPARARAVPAVFEPAREALAGEVVLRAEALSYRPSQRAELVLKRCSLQLQHGDRLLLTGGSGSGKSTLVSLLAGLREPESGSLLYRGLDLRSLGRNGWRRGVALAPQFHENHVLAGTFAFNLLLGRGWPPSASDLSEAECLCRELGLADLLERMPARLQQQVGETGWQLSHGERSRLFLARALLSQAQVVLLDETFAALDPVTLEVCLQTALRHAPTLIVVAHP